MKRISILFYWIVGVLLLFPGQTFSQTKKQTSIDRASILQAAKEIMISAGTCALVTVDKDGQARVRAMDPFLPEKDFTVWFGTNPRSRKVKQIKKNPGVTLYYADPDGSGYVTMHGRAQLIDHPGKKEQRWKTEWEDFYPNKKKDYLLIKVTPAWLEVVSTTRGIVGDDKKWLPPRVEFNDK